MNLINNIYQRHTNLQQWYQTPLGKVIRQQITTKLTNYIENIFGYYALQLGIIQEEDDFLVNSRITHHIHADIKQTRNTNLIIEYPHLPIASNSLDLAIYLHVLELAPENNANIILQEAKRILISSGYLILVGFNAFSLTKITGILPKKIHCYAVLPLKNLLHQHDFAITHTETLCFNAPWLRQNYQYFPLLEKISYKIFPAMGMIYIIIARKNEIATNIIHPHWQHAQHKKPREGLVNPLK